MLESPFRGAPRGLDLRCRGWEQEGALRCLLNNLDPAVAEQLAPAIGLSVPVVEVALKRQSYGIKPITESVIADQQQVADTFFALGLIPKQIKISDVARRSGS